MCDPTCPPSLRLRRSLLLETLQEAKESMALHLQREGFEAEFERDAGTLYRVLSDYLSMLESTFEQ